MPNIQIHNYFTIVITLKILNKVDIFEVYHYLFT